MMIEQAITYQKYTASAYKNARHYADLCAKFPFNSYLWGLYKKKSIVYQEQHEYWSAVCRHIMRIE